MIIGYLLGIPITIWAVYFVIVKPLIELGERQPSNSVGGRAFSAISVIFALLSILAVLSIVGGLIALLSI